MKFGVCGSPSLVNMAARVGFDYFEVAAVPPALPGEDADGVTRALNAARAAPIPCPVLNVPITGDLKITGPVVDLPALERGVTIACQRAHEAGVEVVVFSAGEGRRVPDSFSRAAARQQLVQFFRMLGPVAARSDITIALEPLNLAETNILTTVAETASLVRTVNHPGIQMLVDAYHLLKDGDSLEDVVAYGELLVHAHIATIPNRLPPGMEPCDLAPFFQALRRGGYDGRVSVEGNIPENEADLRSALQLMRSLL